MATAGVPVARTRIERQRLNLNLSNKAYEELRALSEKTALSMTEVVRIGLGLAKIAIEESERGNKLIVTRATGEPLREIVFLH